jgi:RimJ/RimL family protein N-acetyltransferase
MIELRGEGFLLRPFREDDLAELVATCNDPAVAQFAMEVPYPYREEDARAWLAFCRACYARGDRLPLAIADAETDDYLGSIDIRLGETASIGYLVKREARGRGLATSAVRLVVDWAAREHGIRTFALTTNPDNVASQRVAEKAGFRRVGTRVEDPPPRDGRTHSLVYELRRNSTSEPIGR